VLGLPVTMPVLPMVTVQPAGAWAVRFVGVGEASVDVCLERHWRVLIGCERRGRGLTRSTRWPRCRGK